MVEVEIQAPRDRERSFSAMVVRKIGSATEDAGNIIISLCGKAMSNSEVEEQIRMLQDF